jgi:hypothetical protein
VIRLEDPDRIFAPGGALEAAIAAREAGKSRYIRVYRSIKIQRYISACLAWLSNYSLTQPVSVVITGIDSMPVSIQALTAVKTFQRMTQQQIATLLDRTRDAAANGRFELFKTTAHFDGTAANPKWLG